MAIAFIGLGSNLGDGPRNLLAVWERLGKSEGISLLSLSNPYRTEPLGIATQLWFTNAVGKVETSLSCEDLMKVLLRIEREMGRDRTSGPDRTVDLDMLYYDGLVLEFENLRVPHPEIQNRLFVLAPLLEMAPDFVHPVLAKTTRQMATELAGSSQMVEKLDW